MGNEAACVLNPQQQRSSLMAAAAPARQHLGEMQRLAMAKLRNLLAATETVGEDYRQRARGLDRRQQTVGGNGFRYFELVCLKAEWTGHAAAAGLDGFNHRARLAQQRDLALRTAEDRLVMAVAVDQDVRAAQSADSKTGSLRGEPVGQQPDLLAEEFRSPVFWK